MKIINIKAESGFLPIKAYMVKDGQGLFAIHHPYNMDGDQREHDSTWNITHVPSGLTIANAINTLPEARRIAAHIVTLFNDAADLSCPLWVAFSHDEPLREISKSVGKALGRAISLGRTGRTFEQEGRRHLVTEIAVVYRNPMAPVMGVSA